MVSCGQELPPCIHPPLISCCCTLVTLFPQRAGTLQAAGESESKCCSCWTVSPCHTQSPLACFAFFPGLVLALRPFSFWIHPSQKQEKRRVVSVKARPHRARSRSRQVNTRQCFCTFLILLLWPHGIPLPWTRMRHGPVLGDAKKNANAGVAGPLGYWSALLKA